MATLRALTRIVLVLARAAPFVGAPAMAQPAQIDVPGFWDPKRRPKAEKLILFPMPELTTRLAALRSGQVDWIEVPPPDAIPQLKAAGFQIALNSYPHNWTHTLRLDKEPWNNKLVRKAANYAIDRVGICKSLLNDTCIPATGVAYKGHPWFGNPKETYEYNPAKAKELLKQAGFDGTSKRPAKAVALISTSGSGQMLPLAMNELVQKNLKDVGIDAKLETKEYGAYITSCFYGKFDSMTYGPQTPFLEPDNFLFGQYYPGELKNQSHINDPVVADLLRDVPGLSALITSRAALRVSRWSRGSSLLSTEWPRG